MDHLPLRAHERDRAAAWCRSRAAACCPPSRDRLRRSRSSTPSTTRQYAGEIVEAMRMVCPRSTDGDAAAADRRQVLVLHGADRVRRRRARSATSRASRRRSTGSTSSTSSSRRRAGERVLARATSTTRARRSSSSRSPTRCTRSTRRSSTPGFLAPGRRRRAAARVRLDPLARRLGRGLPPLGGAARRRARPRALGDPARTAIRYHVCLGSWHGPHVFDPPLARGDRPRPPGAGALLPDRAGERPARARVAAVGGRQAARGEGARPRRRHPPHERRRAPRARRRAARAARERSSAATT